METVDFEERLDSFFEGVSNIFGQIFSEEFIVRCP